MDLTAVQMLDQGSLQQEGSSVTHLVLHLASSMKLAAVQVPDQGSLQNGRSQLPALCPATDFAVRGGSAHIWSPEAAGWGAGRKFLHSVLPLTVHWVGRQWPRVQVLQNGQDSAVCVLFIFGRCHWLCSAGSQRPRGMSAQAACQAGRHGLALHPTKLR